MAVVSGALAVTAQVPTVSTGVVENVSIASANTEVSHTLPVGTQKFSIALRPGSAAILKLAFTALASGTTYKTVMPGADYAEAGIDAAATVTLYFQSNIAGQVAEIVSWA